MCWPHINSSSKYRPTWTVVSIYLWRSMTDSTAWWANWVLSLCSLKIAFFTLLHFFNVGSVFVNSLKTISKYKNSGGLIFFFTTIALNSSSTSSKISFCSNNPPPLHQLRVLMKCKIVKTSIVEVCLNVIQIKTCVALLCFPYVLQIVCYNRRHCGTLGRWDFMLHYVKYCLTPYTIQATVD